MTASMWAFAAACVWGVVPLLEKMGLTRSEPFTALFYRCLGVVMGIILLSVFIVRPHHIKSVDAKTIFVLVLSGFLASFVAQILFYHGLKIGEVSRIVPIAGSFPLVTFLLGIIFFGEAVTAAKIAGVVLITSGIWLLK
ncbi:MAG: EamA family transporter [Candidatus Tantalella remota]|nr:EamA family transporter [Candidatus Tantalella remota]